MRSWILIECVLWLDGWLVLLLSIANLLSEVSLHERDWTWVSVSTYSISEFIYSWGIYYKLLKPGHKLKWQKKFLKYQIVIFWTATPPLLLTPPFVRWILEILGKIRHSGWNILSNNPHRTTDTSSCNMSWLKHGMKNKIEKNNVLKQNITKIAKAAFYKLPGKSSLNVNFVCPFCPWHNM